jgi:hypothetical protein
MAPSPAFSVYKYPRPDRVKLSERFNEVVCMDLKEFEHNKTWILHIIDSATRYSAACLINTKKKDVIVARIFQTWICYFGAPKKFLTDNGGEFANQVMMEMNEKLGVETATTAGESPFSSGIVERHNATLYVTMLKTLEDTKCDPEIALAWAVSAKNALQNKGGFSPNQLVFGFNPNLPNVMSDLPPALDGTTSSDVVRNNLEALHSARENYVKAESSERIRRALRHKTRTYSDQVFVNGELVFYKRLRMKGWRGPAKVIGQEGKIVLLRHGTAYYRCHPCQMMKVLTTTENPVQKKTAEMTRPIQKQLSIVNRAALDIDDDEEQCDDKEEDSADHEEMHGAEEDEDSVERDEEKPCWM